MKMEFIDRKTEVNEVLDFLKHMQKNPKETRKSKATNHFIAIHGSPGSGKSRFLLEVANKLQNKNSLIIPITYNQTLTVDGNTISSVYSRFYYRLAYSYIKLT